MLENSKLYRYLKRMEKIVSDSLEQTQKAQQIASNIAQKQEKIGNDQMQKLEEIRQKQQEQQQQIDLLLKRTVQFDVMNTEMLLMRPTSKRKILLLGFYGANNTGDELMLQSLLNELMQHTNECDITVMIADNLEYELSAFGNLHFIHYPKTPSDTSIIMNYFDDLIVGGGALIDDACYQEGRMDNVSNLIIDLGLHAIHKNKRLYLVGLSTSNALLDGEYIEKLKELIENAKFVSLRDSYSIETLKEVGIDTKSVQLTEDLAYWLPPRLAESKQKDEYVLGMVLVTYIDEKTFLSIIQGAEKFLNSIGLDKEKVIHFIPFYDYCHFDVTQYQKYIKAYEGKMKLEIEPYVSDYNKLCNIFNECDMLLCMRYHASLLSLKMAIPVVHLSYDVHRHYLNKMKYLLEQYEAESYNISLKEYDENEYIETLQNAYQNQEQMKEKEKIVTKHIEENAKKQKESFFRLFFNITDKRFDKET